MLHIHVVRTITQHHFNYLLLFIFFLPIYGTAQLITAPNKTKNGIKEGLWNDIQFKSIMDIDGNSHLITNLHYAPESEIQEGIYINGKRHGFWKNYLIERYIDAGDTKYRKGQVKDIYEYNNDYLTGLFISYFENGQVRLLGEYCCTAFYSIDTIPIPNLDNDQFEDKIFESFYQSDMTGIWYAFEKNGELKQTKNYGKKPGCLKIVPEPPKPGL